MDGVRAIHCLTTYYTARVLINEAGFCTFRRETSEIARLRSNNSPLSSPAGIGSAVFGTHLALGTVGRMRKQLYVHQSRSYKDNFESHPSSMVSVCSAWFPSSALSFPAEHKHPGQLCRVSWIKASQSKQKSWRHSGQRTTTLTPAASPSSTAMGSKSAKQA